MSDAPEHDEPAAMTPHPVDQPGALERSSTFSGDRRRKETATEREDAMVREARRLFGPSPPPGGTLAGPIRAGLPLRLVSGGTRCAWSGAEARTIDAPSNGMIEGIVRTESSGQPIPGAFLQILGTGDATFADATGRYRLSFDPALVGACRSQLVRVSAPGFRARTMVLQFGIQSDNAIDMAVRR